MADSPSTFKMSAREFNQELAKAKRAAQKGPVVITDRGRPAHVLLSYEAYEELSQRSPGRSAYDVMREANIAADVPGIEDVDLELPERAARLRVIDFD